MEEQTNLFTDPVPVLKWEELFNTVQQQGGVLKQYGASTSPIGKDLQSPNFKSGVTGWRLKSSGDFEANNGVFRGDVYINRLVVSQNYMQVGFESLSAWAEAYKEGTGAGFSLTRLGMCRVNVGNTATNNRSILCFEHGDGKAFSSEYDCFFQVSVSDDGERLQDLGICMGDYDPFSVNSTEKFGIKYILADKKVYGFYINDSTEYKYEISTGTTYMDDIQIWRAEWTALTSTLKFYFNGILKYTISTGLDSGNFLDGDAVIAFGGKQKDTMPSDNWYSLWTNMYLYFNS